MVIGGGGELKHVVETAICMMTILWYTTCFQFFIVITCPLALRNYVIHITCRFK